MESRAEIVGRKSAFDTWQMKELFELISQNDKNISVKCKLCLPLPKVLSAAVSSTSNLKKHIEVGAISLFSKKKNQPIA